jgi:hypothetical protein
MSTPHRLIRLLHHGADRLIVGRVGHQCECLSPRRAETCDRPVETLTTPRDERDVRALTGERPRHSHPDPAAPTRDQRALTAQFQVYAAIVGVGGTREHPHHPNVSNVI